MSQNEVSSKLSKLTIAPKRTNFPGPPEIHDMIYNDLLNHAEVRCRPYYTRPSETMSEYSESTKRCASVAHTYRFDSGILGVNKTIAAEAKKRLCNFNTFIKVSWQWPRISSKIHLWDVPIVTEDQNAIARFSDHSMCVDLIHPGAAFYSASDPQLREYKQNYVLMLLPDFKLFCRAARWDSLWHTSAKIWYTVRMRTTDSDEVFTHINDHPHRFRLELTFRAPQFKPFTNELQEALLTALKELRIPGHQVVQSNAASHVQVSEKALDSLRNTTGGRGMLASVIAWDVIYLAQEMIEVANMLATQGDFLRAAARYHNVMFLPNDHLLGRINRRRLANSDAMEPIVLLSRILMDVCGAYGLLKARQLHLNEVHIGLRTAEWWTVLLGWFPSWRTVLGYGGPSIQSYLETSAVGHLALLHNFDRHWRLDEVREAGQIVTRFQVLKTARPSSPHISHDFTLVKSLHDRWKAHSKKASMIGMTSARKLQPQMCNFDLPEHVVKPEIEGWDAFGEQS